MARKQYTHDGENVKMYQTGDLGMHVERVDEALEDQSEEMDYDDDEDIGCIACGNPAYPNCKTSCPLFDD